MHSGQRFRLDTGRWTATQCDAGFGARTSCVRTGPSGAAIRTACELRRSSGMMTSSDRGQQAARQDLHGGAAPCETAAGSAASSSPDTRAFGQRGGGGFRFRHGRIIPARAATGECRPARPMSTRRLATRPMTGGLHISVFSRFKIKPENNLSREKIDRK
jgi:hypothetical protein